MINQFWLMHWFEIETLNNVLQLLGVYLQSYIDLSWVITTMAEQSENDECTFDAIKRKAQLTFQQQ